jgi:hypothetical protein
MFTARAAVMLADVGGTIRFELMVMGPWCRLRRCSWQKHDSPVG